MGQFTLKRMMAAMACFAVACCCAAATPHKPVQYDDDVPRIDGMLEREILGRIAAISLGVGVGAMFGRWYWWIVGAVAGRVIVFQIMTALFGAPDWP
ncbi:MAG TPA: hypothetical protein VHV77_13970 [Pirellulales bacterium]|jgi:hypothetical protein|nr:hypothetical protein [Pirellulales bacterium]